MTEFILILKPTIFARELDLRFLFLFCGSGVLNLGLHALKATTLPDHFAVGNLEMGPGFEPESS
jgi:hypothetical protein